MDVLRVETNKTFDELSYSQKRISVFQGGARSGKTYNILLWLIYMSSTVWHRKTISICRTTYPSLRATVMRDFFEILKGSGRYDEARHNRQENAYFVRDNMFEFFSVDMPQKYRGRKRHVLFMNEANEFEYESWTQLTLRTSEKVILDFNPSMIEHWIYERVMTRADCDVYYSTFSDNPFLEAELVAEIKMLEQTDKTLWTVYGLGQRAQIGGLIYTNWELVDEIPQGGGYGLDFGYTNAPTAILNMHISGRDIYMDERLYQTHLTNPDIGAFLKQDITRGALVVADSAEQKSIDEINGMGINIVGAAKGPNSVGYGIQVMQQFRLLVTRRSVNLQKELKRYKWREDKNGNYTNEPVKVFDHLLDAARYYVTHNLENGTVFTAVYVPKRKNKI